MSNIEDLFSPAQSFAGLRPPYCELADAQTVILPVPYDGTSEWHSGSRRAPHAIIDASQYLELYDLELNREIYRTGIHTLPELEPVLLNPEAMTERVLQVTRLVVKQSKLIVIIGGEHSRSRGPVKALKEQYQDISVLQLDAHADLRDTYQGTPYSHACIMRRVIEHCPVTQVGIRSLCTEEKDFIKQNNLKPFYYQDTSGLPVEQIVASLSDTVYVTIDMDVFDPSMMAAVATPEPGGLQWYETLNLLKEIASHKKIVGFDVMELCPSQGPAACIYTAAKLIYKLIGYIAK
jgi:agmatinase